MGPLRGGEEERVKGGKGGERERKERDGRKHPEMNFWSRACALLTLDLTVIYGTR